jgi:LytS/YehU family sensor histidine kinase
MELEQLKITIQPHFLMNTLTAIRGWLIDKPRKAVKLLDALSEEMRPIFMLANKKEITMTEEIEICRSHLEVMGYRHDRKYRLTTNNISGYELVPPLIFHTMVENAFTHQKQGTYFNFFISRETMTGGYRYIFTVDGVPLNISSSEEGTGGKYIRTRLEESYPGQWSMHQESVEGNWRTVIEIRDHKK